jgi:FKBP-type peptidyl-prolyl cis-trans isomerase
MWTCASIVVMRISILRATGVFTIVALFLGAALAQQAPVSATKSSTSAKSSSSTKTSTTAKPDAAPAAKKSEPLTLTTKKQKQSYAIGMNIGIGMNKSGVDIDPAILAAGVNDAMAGGKTLITEAEAREVFLKLRSEMMAKQQAETQRVGEANKQAGEQFLAANKSKEGIVTLPSGLQYKVLKDGAGSKPTASDSVVCNYRGTLIDGKEFDSSYKRGEPATLSVGEVIKGWTEALQLMPVGSKWQLYVPADLAYGERSPSPDIPPNSALVFDVELLSIKGK